MQPVSPMEIGVMMWAGRDSLAEMKALGVRCGQLGIAGEYDLSRAAEAWKADLAREGFSLVTVFCAYIGESYADAPTVQQTVGFIPPATRASLRRRASNESVHRAPGRSQNR